MWPLELSSPLFFFFFPPELSSLPSAISVTISGELRSTNSGVLPLLLSFPLSFYSSSTLFLPLSLSLSLQMKLGSHDFPLQPIATTRATQTCSDHDEIGSYSLLDGDTGISSQWSACPGSHGSSNECRPSTILSGQARYQQVPFDPTIVMVSLVHDESIWISKCTF